MRKQPVTRFILSHSSLLSAFCSLIPPFFFTFQSSLSSPNDAAILLTHLEIFLQELLNRNGNRKRDESGTNIEQLPRLSRMDAAIDAMFQLGYSEEKVWAHVKQLLKEYGGDEGWPFIEEGSYRELIESFLREEERNAQLQVAQCGNQSMDKSCGNGSIVAGTSCRASHTQQDEGTQDNTPADIAGSSGAVAGPTCPESGITIDGNRWKDIHTYLVSKNNEDQRTNSHSPRTSRIPSSPSLDTPPCLPPTKSQKRPPCNGWIESDEDQTFGQFKETANLVTKSGITASQSLTKTPSQPPTMSQKRLPCYGWIESDEEDGSGFMFLEPKRGELSKRMNDITKWKIRRRSRWDERPDDAC